MPPDFFGGGVAPGAPANRWPVAGAAVLCLVANDGAPADGGGGGELDGRDGTGGGVGTAGGAAAARGACGTMMACLQVGQPICMPE